MLRRRAFTLNCCAHASSCPAPSRPNVASLPHRPRGTSPELHRRRRRPGCGCCPTGSYGYYADRTYSAGTGGNSGCPRLSRRHPPFPGKPPAAASAAPEQSASAPELSPLHIRPQTLVRGMPSQHLECPPTIGPSKTVRLPSARSKLPPHQAAQSQPQPTPAPQQAPAAAPQPAAAPVPATGGSGDVEALRRAWPDVLQTLTKIKRSTWHWLNRMPSGTV